MYGFVSRLSHLPPLSISDSGRLPASSHGDSLYRPHLCLVQESRMYILSVFVRAIVCGGFITALCVMYVYVNHPNYVWVV